MIAKEYGITREDTDRFGLRSQTLADPGVAGRPLRLARWRRSKRRRSTRTASRPARSTPSRATRGCARRRSRSSPRCKPVEPGGVHTAGTSSQVSDGAAAVLLASPRTRQGARPQAARAHRHHDAGRRRPGDDAEGPDPIDAQGAQANRPRHRRHRRLRGQRGLRLRRPRLDEGAASPTPNASTRTAAPSPSATRPAAPARASSPPRCTSWSAPERRYGLIAMCCGGGLGTGTIIERM